MIRHLSVIGVMNRLTQAGIALHLDDFGTGYSSLGSLHQFPVKGLKVDRSFIVSASGRRDYAAVLHAIVALADNLGLDVVGEGIETPEQLALCQSLNCPLGQDICSASRCPRPRRKKCWQVGRACQK